MITSVVSLWIIIVFSSCVRARAFTSCAIYIIEVVWEQAVNQGTSSQNNMNHFKFQPRTKAHPTTFDTVITIVVILKNNLGMLFCNSENSYLVQIVVFYRCPQEERRPTFPIAAISARVKMKFHHSPSCTAAGEKPTARRKSVILLFI